MKHLLIITLFVCVSLLATIPAYSGEDENLANQLAGKWVNEGGYSWYRINVSGNKVEIFLIEYCAFGDCNQKRTINRKDFRGVLEGDQLVGYALNLPELPFEYLGRQCLKPAGDFPRKGTISSGGRKIIWKIPERPVYGGCSDPMSKGLEIWFRE